MLNLVRGGGGPRELPAAFGPLGGPRACGGGLAPAPLDLDPKPYAPLGPWGLGLGPASVVAAGPPWGPVEVGVAWGAVERQGLPFLAPSLRVEAFRGFIPGAGFNRPKCLVSSALFINLPAFIFLPLESLSQSQKGFRVRRASRCGHVAPIGSGAGNGAPCSPSSATLTRAGWRPLEALGRNPKGRRGKWLDYQTTAIKPP